MNNGGKPVAVYYFHRGANFYIQVVALIVLILSIIMTKSLNHQMAIARFSLWAQIFAFCMVLIVLSIYTLGNKIHSIFYSDRFEIRFSMVAKKQIVMNSDLTDVTVDKNVLSLTIKNLDKQQKLALMLVKPSDREKLTNQYKQIVSKV